MELVKVAPAELLSWEEFCFLILIFPRSATNPGFEMWTSFISTLLVNFSTTSDIRGRSFTVSCTHSSPTLRNFMASSSGKFLFNMGSTSFNKSLDWYAIHTCNCKHVQLQSSNTHTYTSSIWLIITNKKATLILFHQVWLNLLSLKAASNYEFDFSFISYLLHYETFKVLIGIHHC